MKSNCFEQAGLTLIKVKMKGREPWTTQLFVKGDPGNQQDRLWRSIGEQRARDSVTVDFAPIKGSRTGELAARFDIVLGATPRG
jgi:protocatechuate 3,4-dioxygenase beta subunit